MVKKKCEAVIFESVSKTVSRFEAVIFECVSKTVSRCQRLRATEICKSECS